MEQPGDPGAAFLAFLNRMVGDTLKLFKLVPAFQAPVFIDRQFCFNPPFALRALMKIASDSLGRMPGNSLFYQSDIIASMKSGGI